MHLRMSVRPAVTAAFLLAAATMVALLAAFHVTGVRADGHETVLIREGGDASTMLTGQNGMTLYTFDRDEAGVSNCSGRCAETWPPLLLTEGDPAAPDGLPGMLSVLTRADGSRQVAYNDRPLYFYAGDSQPGDNTGDGVGGVWHTARP